MSKAFVLINTNPSSEADVESALKNMEGIVEVYQVYGVYDLIVQVEAASDQELKEETFSKIRTIKHVRSVLTLSVR